MIDAVEGASDYILMPTVYGITVGATNRDLYIDNTGKLGYVSSSLRYKENISELGAIDWLYQLRPVEFDYKAGGHAWGLIAEEVDEIQNMLVSYDRDGRPESVEYSRLIVPLLRAVQELKKEIHETK